MLGIDVLYQLSRPHALKGHVLAILVMCYLAWISCTVKPSFGHIIRTVILTFISTVSGNVYTQTINQINDYDIDKINKPWLPFAAGQLTYNQMIILAIISTIACFGGALLVNKYLLVIVSMCYILATLYSLPPFRLKRYPLCAMLIILCGRGGIYHPGLFISYYYEFSGSTEMPVNIIIFCIFMVGLCSIIALAKDIPDISGDKQHGIITYSVRFGANSVLFLCKLILTTIYVVNLFIYWNYGDVNKINFSILTMLHLLSPLYLWYGGIGVDACNRKQVTAYYEGPIWNLFYLQFICFPLCCISAR